MHFLENDLSLLFLMVEFYSIVYSYHSSFLHLNVNVHLAGS